MDARTLPADDPPERIRTDRLDVAIHTSLARLVTALGDPGVTLCAADDVRGAGTRVPNPRGPHRVLRFGLAQLGVLRFTARGFSGATDTPRFTEAEFELARCLARRRATTRSIAALGTDLALFGSSPALARVEGQIARAACVRIPLLFASEAGIEDAAFAYSLHIASGDAFAPFVVVQANRGDEPDAIEDWFERAAAGTLVLRDVEHLRPTTQRSLAARIVEDGRCDALVRTPSSPSVRLVVSSTQDLTRLATDGRFCPALCAQIDALQIRLPPLRERVDDLRGWIDTVVERRGLPAIRFRDDALALLMRHPWPGNLRELERVVTRIAVLGRGLDVDADELRAHWEDGPAPDPRTGPATTAPASLRRDEPPTDEPRSPDDDDADDDEAPLKPYLSLAADVLDGDFARLGATHPVVRRVIAHLHANYREEQSLDRLSRAVFASESHLCHVLKRELGISFRRLLVVVRVEAARRRLVDDPDQRVTEIALDVGFGDFSHFLKCFKRVTGSSPREYRRRCANLDATDLETS